MSVLNYLGLLLPLGIAGFDPTPALLAVYYLSVRPGKRSRRAVFVFCLSIILGIVVWGLLLTAVLGETLNHLPWKQILSWIVSSRQVPVLVGKLVCALLLVTYGIYSIMRIRFHAHRLDSNEMHTKKMRFTSPVGLALFTLGFLAIITFEISFTTYIALSAQQPLPIRSLGLLGWATISQLPLVLLLLLMLYRREAIFGVMIDAIRRRCGRLFAYIVPALCFSLGAILCADVFIYPVLQAILGIFLKTA
ncbi:hypothetical protein [Rothia sp. P7208]|uniref:hypothetical protein n=1 Tax=Rothia sp. P7208 TaxID=3402660 RepID=UPI003AC318BB